MNEQQETIKLLQTLWPKNKAKGLLAQAVFHNDVENNVFGADAKEKIFEGCWLLAPKSADFYKFRFCFFVHPAVLDSALSVFNLHELLGNGIRPFHAIAEFMNNSGIGVLYAVPTVKNGNLPFNEMLVKQHDSIAWKLYFFSNGSFVPVYANVFFNKWEGNRGHIGPVTEWDGETKEKFVNVDSKTLKGLLLHELFYAGLLKSVLKKPLNDPYDIDAFVISMSQKHIFPVEIKEKFPGMNKTEKFFGIDAGRIMMLLRLCLPNESNALYLIRELTENREFVAWKYITLSDIIMTSSWNLQAGGPGMGGQSTQTIRLPYEYFKTFGPEDISEDILKKKSSLPKEFKETAAGFLSELKSKYY